MNIKIEKLLEDYCKEKGWAKWENNRQLLEVLHNFKILYKDSGDEHRHWIEYAYVIKVRDTYIGFNNATTTGDMSAEEVGYDFDPDSICEMERVERTITTYIIKNGK